jgi:hypothetical protein
MSPMRSWAFAGNVHTPPCTHVRPSRLVEACSSRSPLASTRWVSRSQVVSAGGPMIVPP